MSNFSSSDESYPIQPNPTKHTCGRGSARWVGRDTRSHDSSTEQHTRMSSTDYVSRLLHEYSRAINSQYSVICRGSRGRADHFSTIFSRNTFHSQSWLYCVSKWWWFYVVLSSLCLNAMPLLILSICNPPIFIAGCPSCCNPPNLSWPVTGTESCWVAYPVANN